MSTDGEGECRGIYPPVFATLLDVTADYMHPPYHPPRAPLTRYPLRVSLWCRISLAWISISVAWPWAPPSG